MRPLLLTLIPALLCAQTHLSPSEMALSDASVANLGSSYSVGGFINVLAYACGITIGDGQVHTIANAPAGNCFNGITTLSGVASISIRGAQPFGWINASSNNIFTSSTGDYKLTNSTVSKLDIAWLCIQSALLQGRTYIPVGSYVIGSTTALPLYMPITNPNVMYSNTVQPDVIKGDGEFATNLIAGSDFGIGVPLLSCGDPSGNATNQLGRYIPNSSCQGLAENFTLWSNQGDADFAVGAAPVAMDGFAWGAQLSIENVASNGFYNDWTIVGDHTTLINASAQGGTRGFYFAAPNTVRTGDLTFVALYIAGVSQAGIAVNGAATIAASFLGETYISAPYPFFGEAGGCSPILQGTEFDRLMTEYTGNAFITDDNGFSNGVYNDTSKCRAVNTTTIGNWFPAFTNITFWSAGGRARRAGIDVAQINGLVINKLNSDGGSFAPPAAPSGPAPLATINANIVMDNGLGNNRIAGHISSWIAASGSMPLVRCPVSPSVIFLEQPGEYTALLTDWYVSSGNYSSTTVGDVFEHSQYSYSPGGQGYDNTPDNVLPGGIVMQAGITPTAGSAATAGLVPIQISGMAGVNVGYGPFTWNAVKKASGIGRVLSITSAGSGGTNGTYTWTATGGGCVVAPTGSLVVSGGAITSTTITNHGSGCTSIPTIPTSAATGLQNGVLTPIWPGALGTAAATLSGPILGMTHAGSTPGNGNNVLNVRLQGLSQ